MSAIEKVIRALAWLLLPAVCLGANVYNFFPPPGTAYSNAAASSFDVGTTATTSAEFSVGNNPLGLTGAATLTIGSPIGTAGGGAILNLSDGGTSAGNNINSDDAFHFNSTSPLNAVDFNVTNNTATNTFLIDPNNDSRYTIGNLTGASSDGSFTARNKSSAAAGTTSIGVETNINGAPNIGMFTCTTPAGTLAANGIGPGVPGSITGAPASTGCALGARGNSSGLIFYLGNVYAGGWNTATTGFNLAAPSSGPGLTVAGGSTLTGTTTLNGSAICTQATGCGTGSVFVAKAADTNRTLTTTPTADPDLQFTSQAAGTYALRCYLDWNINTIGAVYTITTAGTLTRGTATGLTVDSAQGTVESPVTLAINGGNHSTTALGSAITSSQVIADIVQSTSGTIAVNWAQIASSASAVTLHQGSWCELTKIL